MGILYRPELDGLRAIAVLAVVAYHAKLGGAGFVGVDVFFVISGYLITALLLREHGQTGRIDLVDFYARRVRRILPAAVGVVLSVLAVAWLLLSADAFIAVANSAVAAALFVANLSFQSVTGGYWSADAEQMPLLHLWSLAVEEQFYLLWPAMLIAILRWRPVLLKPAILSLAACSLVSAEWLIHTNPIAAFYQMPARFWELAAGGLIAAMPMRALPRGVGWLGVLVTLAACLWQTPTFPGLGAAPAVLGAAIIILSVHGGGTNVLLRSRPLVGVGLISYSLYLWHWPLLAFYRATSIGEGDLQVRLILCGCAFVLAFFSYRYVEQPFRRVNLRGKRTVVIGASLSIVVALSACAMSLRTQGDQIARADNPAAIAAGRDMPDRSCHLSLVDTAVIKCQPRTRTLLWGDSMAWAWLPGFPGTSDVTMDSCPPMADYMPPRQLPGYLLCGSHNRKVMELATNADMVIITASWQANPVLDMQPTFNALAGVPSVLVIGPTPRMRDDVPRCIRQHAEAQCAITRAEFDAIASPILERLSAQSANYPNVTLLDVTDCFCTATTCPPIKEGIAMYWDSHHISATAAKKCMDATQTRAH